MVEDDVLSGLIELLLVVTEVISRLGFMVPAISRKEGRILGELLGEIECGDG